MPAWAVWIVVLTVIYLISMIPVRVIIGYSDEFRLMLRIIFFPIYILPKKKPKTPDPSKYTPERYRKKLEKLRRDEERKKKKKEQAAAKKAAKKNKKQQKKQEKQKEEEKSGETGAEKKKLNIDIPEAIELSVKVIKALFGTFGRHLRVTASRLHITVASTDAATTAVMYGAISQSLAYTMEILNRVSNFKYKKDDFSLTVDFCSDKIKADVLFIFKIRIWHVFWVLIKTLFTGLPGGIKILRAITAGNKKDKKAKDERPKDSGEGETPENESNPINQIGEISEITEEMK